MAKWKMITKEKDYKVWRKGRLATTGNQVAVYRGIFMTTTIKGGTRSYHTKNMKAGIKRAKAYMDKRKGKYPLLPAYMDKRKHYKAQTRRKKNSGLATALKSASLS
tara:strand:- start:142 stop:459 length:318 start_codon:yes stop_codon:yes gene_type:complete